MLKSPPRFAGKVWFVAFLLMVAGCGSSNSDYVFTSNVNQPSQTSSFDAFGRVYLTQQAATSVQLVDASSGTVLQTLATDSAGQFVVPRGTALPGRYLLRANAPEGIAVERLVDSSDPSEYLWLNVPSTLISRYRQAQPEATAAEALVRLKQALSIWENEGVYGTGASYPSPFSHHAFLRHAGAAGAAALQQQVLDAMRNGARLSFRAEKRVVGRDLRVQAFDVRAESLAAEVGKFLIEEPAGIIYEKSLDETANELGKATGLAGLKLGKSAKYEAVVEALGDILEDLSELSDEVNQDYLDTLTTGDQNQLDDYLTSVNTAYGALQDLARDYYTEIVDAGEGDVFDHGTGAIPDSRTSQVQLYSAVTGSNATQALRKFLTSSTAGENLLSLKARSVTSELLPSNQANSTAEFSYYPIRKDPQTEELVNNYLLYAGYVTQVAMLNSEQANSNYLPQNVIVSGSGGSYAPPAVEVTSAYHANNALVDLTNLAEAQSVPEGCGSDLVFIDVPNRKMWYLTTSLGKYDEAQNGLIDLEINNWKYPYSSAKPPRIGDSLENDLQGFTRPSTLDGWRVPEVAEFDQLRALLSDIDENSLGDAQKTFSALTKLGFTGLINPSDDNNDNYKKFWYNGSVQDGGIIPELTNFMYYDMKEGGVNNGGGPQTTQPKFTIAYVRNLSGFDSGPNFGDTTGQIVRAYGEPADYLTLDSVGTTSPNGLVGIFSFRLSGHMNNDATTGTPSASLADIATSIVVTDENGSSLDPPAFYQYRIVEGPNGEDETLVDFIFKRKGTATLTAQVTGKTVSKTITSSVIPELTGIVVSPQNLQLQGIPDQNTSYQYYCTGYLATGEAVDLTRKVRWSVVTPSGGTTPTVIGNGTNGGLLEFGSEDSLSPLMTVRADYLAGPDDPAFGDYGQSYSDDSNLAVPTR